MKEIERASGKNIEGLTKDADGKYYTDMSFEDLFIKYGSIIISRPIMSKDGVTHHVTIYDTWVE